MDFSSEIARISILFLGDSSVGKTSLIKRYSEEKFSSKYSPTVGLDYGVKSDYVAGKEVRVSFWDLSGNPEYDAVVDSTIKNNVFDAVCFVFDVSNVVSYNNIPKWLNKFSKTTKQNSALFLLGNKCELPSTLNFKEIHSFADSKGLAYYTISGNTGNLMGRAFNDIFKTAYNGKGS